MASSWHRLGPNFKTRFPTPRFELGRHATLTLAPGVVIRIDTRNPDQLPGNVQHRHRRQFGGPFERGFTVPALHKFVHSSAWFLLLVPLELPIVSAGTNRRQPTGWLWISRMRFKYLNHCDARDFSFAISFISMPRNLAAEAD